MAIQLVLSKSGRWTIHHNALGSFITYSSPVILYRNYSSTGLFSQFSIMGCQCLKLVISWLYLHHHLYLWWLWAIQSWPSAKVCAWQGVDLSNESGFSVLFPCLRFVHFSNFYSFQTILKITHSSCHALYEHGPIWFAWQSLMAVVLHLAFKVLVLSGPNLPIPRQLPLPFGEPHSTSFHPRAWLVFTVGFWSPPSFGVFPSYQIIQNLVP